MLLGGKYRAYTCNTSNLVKNSALCAGEKFEGR